MPPCETVVLAIKVNAVDAFPGTGATFSKADMQAIYAAMQGSVDADCASYRSYQLITQQFAVVDEEVSLLDPASTASFQALRASIAEKTPYRLKEGESDLKTPCS